MQFLYTDGEAAHFMNTETYEQIELPEGTLKDALKWIKVNDEVEILFIDDQASDVQVPGSVDLEVTETDPGCEATPPPEAGPSRRHSRRGSWFRYRCSSRPGEDQGRHARRQVPLARISASPARGGGEGYRGADGDGLRQALGPGGVPRAARGRERVVLGGKAEYHTDVINLPAASGSSPSSCVAGVST